MIRKRISISLKEERKTTEPCFSPWKLLSAYGDGDDDNDDEYFFKELFIVIVQARFQITKKKLFTKSRAE